MNSAESNQPRTTSTCKTILKILLACFLDAKKYATQTVQFSAYANNINISSGLDTAEITVIVVCKTSEIESKVVTNVDKTNTE